MRNINLQNITDGVIKANSGLKDERTKVIMESLVRHLHDFARETNLTSEEWEYGLDFLYRAGDISDENRNEFMILSDSLGLSSVVDLNRDASGHGDVTQASPLGPFFVSNLPFTEYGTDLGADLSTMPILLHGRVLDVDGDPIGGAAIDLWQTDAQGLYDVQYEDRDGYSFRARQRGLEDGRYKFKTILPKGYVAPTDGPGGELLLAASRSIWRPGHYHFRVQAEGYRTLVTELFFEGDEHLADDVAFGVRESLVVDPVLAASEDAAQNEGMPYPYSEVKFDFRLIAE